MGISYFRKKGKNIYFLRKIERINYSNFLFQLALTKARAKQQCLVCLYNSPKGNFIFCGKENKARRKKKFCLLRMLQIIIAIFFCISFD